MKMKSITLEVIHEDILNLKREIDDLKNLMKEDFELSDSLITDMKESRKRSKKEFISHEEMRKEFS